LSIIVYVCRYILLHRGQSAGRRRRRRFAISTAVFASIYPIMCIYNEMPNGTRLRTAAELSPPLHLPFVLYSSTVIGSSLRLHQAPERSRRAVFTKHTHTHPHIVRPFIRCPNVGCLNNTCCRRCPENKPMYPNLNRRSHVPLGPLSASSSLRASERVRDSVRNSWQRMVDYWLQME